jgi:type I restriction enzyme S subunit
MKFDSQVQTLGDLMRLDSGFAFKSSEWVESGTPVIKIRNVQDSFVDLSGCSFVNEKTAKKAAGWYGQVGNTLIALTGAGVGEIGRIHENQTGLINQRVGWVRPKDNEEEDYIYYLLRFFKNEIIELASGSAQPNVSPRDILKIPCQVPKKQERRTIGNLLTALDSKIATNNALSKTLEDIAQTIFKSWFIDFDPVKARMAGEKPAGMDAATAALFPDSMEESELGLIPKGWNISNLGNYIKVTKGKSYKSSELEMSNTALVTLKSFMRGGGYRFDGLKPFSGDYKIEQVVEPGELIVSFTDVTQAADVIGKPAIVLQNPKFSKLVASLDVGIVRVVGNKIGKNYLYQLFSTPIFKNHIDGYTNGTTVLHLGKGALEDFEIAMPNENLMNKFEELATSMNSQTQVLYLQNLVLGEIRDSLLPRLISGELQIPEEMLAS